MARGTGPGSAPVGSRQATFLRYETYPRFAILSDRPVLSDG